MGENPAITITDVVVGIAFCYFVAVPQVSCRPAGLGPGRPFFLRKKPGPRSFPSNWPFVPSFAWSRIHGIILGGSVNRFFRTNQPSLTQLGPLEQRLLGELWSRNNATVRELIDYSQLEMAYTTVMTTLDRLFKKGLLDRTEEGRAFRYFPRVTREELQREAAGHAIQQLLGSGPASLPLSYLVEAVTEHDTQLLDELQQLVEKKRRELRDRE